MCISTAIHGDRQTTWQGRDAPAPPGACRALRAPPPRGLPVAVDPGGYPQLDSAGPTARYRVMGDHTVAEA
ncbi:hypothetical protein, partial [Nocardia carnea]|uniref:hypothetical protein n=1 Tax=Nocardia carnea TaxID=37328 RepID=UPI0024573C2A